MRRLRGLLQLLTVVACEVGAAAVFWRLTEVESWRVDWSGGIQSAWRWTGVTPTADVAIGLASWAGLALAAWLLVSTLAYLVAALSGVPGLIRATSLVTLPGVQRLVQGVAAAGLAAAVVLPSGAAFAQTPGRGAAPVPAAAAPAPAVAAPTSAPAPDPTDTVPVVAELHHVVPGDNFWVVAEAEFTAQVGRPPTMEELVPYWRQTIDASMPMRSGDEDLIFPGEDIVRVPAPGAIVRSLTPSAPPAAAVTPPVAPVAPVAPVPPPVPPPVAPAPAPATPAPATSVVTTPPTTAPTTAAPTTTVAARSILAAEAPDDTAVPSVPVADPVIRAGSSKSMTATALPWGAGVLLAGGVVRWIMEQRRRAGQRRLPDEALFEPEDDLVDIEIDARVAAAADPTRIRFVEAALRALSTEAWGDGDALAPIGLIVGPEHLDVVLSGPAVAPTPFNGRGTHWTISRGYDLDDLEDLAGDRPMPLPALVTLGSNADGHEVVLNLEEPGMVSVVGPGAAELVNAAALQLATAQWSQKARVVLVGFPTPPPGVRAADSLDEVIDDLKREAMRTAEFLCDAGCATTFEARMRGVAPDTWDPTVVVCASAPSPLLAQRLVDIVDSAEAHGVVALVAGHVERSSWELTVGDGGIVLADFGTSVVVVQEASGSQEAKITAALEAAAHAPVPAPAGTAVAEDGVDVIIDVYGAIRVEGFDFSGTPGKSLEAFVFLGCHNGDVIDADRLVDALWPRTDDPERSGRTLSTRIFDLRQVVGDHVPKLGRRYAVGDRVATSVQVIAAALLAARGPATAVERENLRRALERVRGRPFDQPTRAGHGGGRPQTAWEWAFADNSVNEALRVAGDAAHRLFELAMEAGDHDVAREAIRQGLRADPDNGTLRRDELLLARSQADADALEDVMRQVERVADEAGIAVDPATVETYHAAQEALAG